MEHFKINKEKFIKLHKATVDYAFSLEPSNNGSLVFYNCKSENKRLPSELCYASIEEQMHDLNIKRISLSAEECTRDSIMYDKVYYFLENNGVLCCYVKNATIINSLWWGQGCQQNHNTLNSRSGENILIPRF